MKNPEPISRRCRPFKVRSYFTLLRLPAAVFPLLLLILEANVASATILGPYTPDADTLHLWHMNDQTVPVIDLGSDGLHLTALRNGATLGNASYKGFGTALSTYDGGPDAVTDVGRDAYLSARPLVNGLSDNVTMTYAGVSNAFTYEAIVRVDFDPQANFGTNGTGNGRGTFMQIINLDADESTNRVCQFRFVPVGVLKGNTEPMLEFINLNKDKSLQSLTAPVPTNGADAINFGGWYHVAVTYSGEPNRPDNLKFYWTLLDPGRTVANLIGTGQMLNNLASGCAPDFAIGQTGRQSPVTPYPNNNFVGLIDEVRLSGIARSPSQMLFGGPVMVAAAPPTTPPANPPPVSSAQPSSSKAPDVIEVVHDKTNERSSAVTWLIAGALLIIAVFLGWLAFAIKRLLPSGSGNTQSVVSHAVETQFPARITLTSAEGAASAQHERTISNGHARQQPEFAPQMAASLPPSTVKQPENGTSFRNRSPRETPELQARTQLQGALDDEPAEDAAESKEGAEAPAEVGFRGVLRKVGLQDLIQMECLNRKSSILEISNSNLHGHICIEQGEIIHAAAVHAVAGECTGEEAFIRLLSLRGGKFSLKPFEAQEKRTISVPWIQLLMDAARRRDEDTETFQRSRSSGISFTRSNTTSADDILTMAGILADHPQVKEILVCSGEGKQLYSSRCENPAGREQMCAALSSAAKTLSELLPVGEFVSLEIVRSDSKTILQKEQGCHLLIDLEHNLATVS